MSTGAKPDKLELLPFQKQNVATNQQSVPLPYLAGTRLLAVRWITPAMNLITKEAQGNGKGK